MSALHRSNDYERIREIMTHPEVYPWISDDHSPAREDFEPIESNEIFYLLWDGGVFMFIPINGITVEIHTSTLPEFQGKTLPFVKQAFEWIFSQTHYQKIITHVPQDNRKAAVFAQKAGMCIEGFSAKSYLKDGEMMGQILLGVSCQRQQ